MKRQFDNLLKILIIIILLSSCTSNTTRNIPSNTAVSVPTFASSIQPESTKIPVYPECNENTYLYSFNGSLPGKLLVDDKDHNQYTLINLQNGSIKSIPKSGHGPTNKYEFILEDYSHDLLIHAQKDSIDVYSNQLQSVRRIPIPTKGENYIPSFASHKYIALNYIYKGEIGNEGKPPAITLVTMVDPTTGKIFMMSQMFPGMRDDVQWANHTSIVTSFDPTLKLVYYLKDESYVLYDIEKNKELVDTKSIHFGLPEWSYNGNYALIFSPEGSIVQIDRIGQSKDLTSEIQGENGTIMYKSELAPNDSMIALPLSHYGQTNPIISVYNMKTARTAGYCGRDFTTQGIVWSPDSQYLAVKVNGSDNELSGVVIIDLVTKRRYRLEGNFSPLGWVN
jgi:hypothetical protein